jgi:hypothetical protein
LLRGNPIQGWDAYPNNKTGSNPWD